MVVQSVKFVGSAIGEDKTGMCFVAAASVSSYLAFVAPKSHGMDRMCVCSAEWTDGRPHHGQNVCVFSKNGQIKDHHIKVRMCVFIRMDRWKTT